jgi:predicted RNA binding protein YcfA (HicA-like mRNA interferase family)
MDKLPVMSAKDFYGLLLRYGCLHVSSKGSHFKVENPKKGICYSIPIHGGRDMQRGFMKTVLTKLGIDIDDFLSKL